MVFVIFLHRSCYYFEFICCTRSIESVLPSLELVFTFYLYVSLSFFKIKIKSLLVHITEYLSFRIWFMFYLSTLHLDESNLEYMFEKINIYSYIYRISWLFTILVQNTSIFKIDSFLTLILISNKSILSSSSTCCLIV